MCGDCNDFLYILLHRYVRFYLSCVGTVMTSCLFCCICSIFHHVFLCFQNGASSRLCTPRNMVFDDVITGYHVYKDVWDPILN